MISKGIVKFVFLSPRGEILEGFLQSNGFLNLGHIWGRLFQNTKYGIFYKKNIQYIVVFANSKRVQIPLSPPRKGGVRKRRRLFVFLRRDSFDKGAVL